MSSDRLATLARWFCIPNRCVRNPPKIDEALLRRVQRFARPGRIILLSGPSGSGKSLLLRRLGRRLARRAIVSLDSIDLPDHPLVECFGNQPLGETLSLLSRMGLAEAWSYFRTPKQLSEGQRWRTKLALCVEKTRGATDAVLVADEFCALLDRLTAAIVARSLRRLIDAHSNLCAIVATSHDDLIRALQPDLIVRCDFGKFTLVCRTR
jgi:uncharacterized protein